MRIARIFAVAAVCMLCLATSLMAQEKFPNVIVGGEPAYMGHVVVNVDAEGNVTANTDNTNKVPMDSLVLEVAPGSDWAFSVGEDPDGDNFYNGCAFDKGFFNVCRPDKVAVIDVNGVGAWENVLNFGQVVAPADVASMADSVLVSGSHKGGGNLYRFQDQSTTGLQGPVLALVPEPSTLVLFGLGLLGLIGLRRRS